MSRETRDPVEAVLENVKSSRRDVLKRLLIGAGAMALMVPMSSVLANAQEATGAAKAKGTGEAKGAAKTKGTGKAKRKAKAKPKGTAKSKTKPKAKGTGKAKAKTPPAPA